MFCDFICVPVWFSSSEDDEVTTGKSHGSRGHALLTCTEEPVSKAAGPISSRL